MGVRGARGQRRATVQQHTWHGDDLAAHALQVFRHIVGGLPCLVLGFDAQHGNRLGADGNLQQCGGREQVSSRGADGMQQLCADVKA